jgi:plasmid maintenance system antidote protein VapI
MIRQPDRWDVHCDGAGCVEVLMCDVKSPRAASDSARAAGWEIVGTTALGEGGPLYDYHYCPECAAKMQRKAQGGDGMVVDSRMQLKARLDAAGVSQRDVARSARLTPSYVNKMLHGERGLTREVVETAERLIAERPAVLMQQAEQLMRLAARLQQEANVDGHAV